jgi:hypothetical protein
MAWRSALADARAIVDMLPPEEVGRAVLDAAGKPFSGDRGALGQALAAGELHFHPGAIRGAVPVVRGPA